MSLLIITDGIGFLWQLTIQRDYVVHIARTPDPVENEVSEENGENDTGDNAQSAKKKPSLEHPSSLEQLDGKWVSTHAKQVILCEHYCVQCNKLPLKRFRDVSDILKH